MSSPRKRGPWATDEIVALIFRGNDKRVGHLRLLQGINHSLAESHYLLSRRRLPSGRDSCCTSLGRLRSLAGAVGATVARVSSAATLSASDRAIYQSAFIAVEDDKWPVAEALAAKAKDPLLAKVILWLDLMRFSSGYDFSEYADFIADNPQWPGQTALQTQAELAMPADLPAKKVLAFFGEREPNTFAGTTQLARALQAGGDKAQAAQVLRRGWVELDAGEDDEKKFLAKFGAQLETEDHIARLDRLLWDSKQDAAKRMLGRVDAGYRALAEARMALRNEKKNADKLVATVPKKLQRDAGLIYERARWRRRKENYAAIPDLFFPPLKEVSRPDMLWRELDDAARRALARGQVKVAYKLAIQHGATDGTTFAEGEWLAGWIALRFLHEPKTAYAHFTRLHGGVASPISKARAAYWAGRAAEDLKKKADAASWYAEAARWPTAYYGQLAAQRAGQRGPLRFATVQADRAAGRRIRQARGWCGWCSSCTRPTRPIAPRRFCCGWWIWRRRRASTG